MQQPNKPGGEIDEEGEPRAVADIQAVKNQSSVRPDDYPNTDGGKPNYKDRGKA